MQKVVTTPVTGFRQKKVKSFQPLGGGKVAIPIGGVGKAEHDNLSTEFFAFKTQRFAIQQVSLIVPNRYRSKFLRERDVLVVELLENDQSKTQGSNPSARTFETSYQENNSLK